MRNQRQVQTICHFVNGDNNLHEIKKTFFALTCKYYNSSLIQINLNCHYNDENNNNKQS